MDEIAREVIISAVESFPAMSATSTKVLKLLNDPNSNLAEVEETVKYDAGMTANILKMANSAYFGFPGTVSSVSQAIATLGWKRMYHLVVASAVSALMERPVPGYDLPRGELWRQAIAGSVVAQIIVKRTKTRGAEEAFTGALLRDIGKLVIGDYVGSYYEQIQIAFAKGISFDQAEREVFSTDHGEVGAWILEHWNIPKVLVDVVRWHSAPDKAEAPSNVMDVVHLADQMATAVSNGLEREQIRLSPCESSLKRLNLAADDLPDIVLDAQDGDRMGQMNLTFGEE